MMRLDGLAGQGHAKALVAIIVNCGRLSASQVESVLTSSSFVLGNFPTRNNREFLMSLSCCCTSV